MKRVVTLLVALCLLMGCFSVASAASKITITTQPTNQTVKAGGTVSFSVKAKGANGAAVTWYFTNPETGAVTTGKKLSSAVKGVKVSSPNSLKITLKKVPEEMHGWTVYCHIGPKNGGVDTDTVMLLISGLPVPEATSAAPAATVQAEASEAAETEETDTTESASAVVSSQSSTTASSSGSAAATVVTVVEEKKPIVITSSSSKLELYALDSKGQISGAAKSELTFDAGSTANFYVKLPAGTEGTIQYITLDNVRLTPDGDVTGMSVRGWNTSATVKVKINTGSGDETDDGSPAPRTRANNDANLDTSVLAKISCTNCRFTGWHNTFAESGEVPVGSTITVFASGGQILKGYSINGEKASHKGEASFQLVVEGDTTITIEEQK